MTAALEATEADRAMEAARALIDLRQRCIWAAVLFCSDEPIEAIVERVLDLEEAVTKNKRALAGFLRAVHEKRKATP